MHRDAAAPCSLAARLAERTLSLVMDRDRAASVTGDLVEMASGNSVWLLLVLVQTWLAVLWKGTLSDWQRVSATALLGIAIFAAAVPSAVISLAIALEVIAGSAHSGGVSILQYLPPGWLVAAGGVALVATIAFQIGQWMAWECPGREIAVCVAFGLFHLVIDLIASSIFGRIYVANTGLAIVFNVLLFAGAIVTRIRTLRPAL